MDIVFSLILTALSIAELLLYMVHIWKDALCWIEIDGNVYYPDAYPDGWRWHNE